MKREVRTGHSSCVCEKLQRLPSTIQRPGRAFTVIELVGVLAIIAIIAAALAPNIIKRIDRAAWQRETSDLNTMANGFIHSVLTRRQIPNSNGLPPAISDYLNLSLNQVQTTPRGFSRLFLIDPLFATVSISPYVQDSSSNGLPARPTNPRVMIISTIAQPAASTISSSFSTIWNTPEGSRPSGWSGNPDDICIKRIDLGPLFHKVYLQNLETNMLRSGYYTFEGNPQPSATSPVPRPVVVANGNVTAYVLDGTVLSLYQRGDPDNLQLRLIIREDLSYAYQNSKWGRILSSDRPDFSLEYDSFGYWVSRFLAAGVPPTPPRKFSVAPQDVVDQFYNYLWAYWSWKQVNFAVDPDETQTRSGNNPGPQNPYFRAVSDAEAKMEDFTAHLIGRH